MSTAQHTPEAFALLREELKAERAVKTELLAALERVCSHRLRRSKAVDEDWNSARAAIAKATGGTT